MMLKSHEILFIHGRPRPHPMHAAFADSVNASYSLVDPVLRWHDRSTSFIKRYLSYLFSALLLPISGKKTILFSDGILFMPAVAKILKIYKNVKLIVLLDDEGLYFIKSNFYPALTRYFAKKALQLADGYVCVGKFQFNILKDLVDTSRKQTVVTFNGIENKKLLELLQVEPNLDSCNLVFIGNGPSGWRIWYKGLDLLILVFQKISEIYHEAKLTIIGSWELKTQNQLIQEVPPDIQAKIKFAGEIGNLAPLLQEASLYIHPSRGEAWGISVTEAMAAGLPALVTNITGSAEVVQQVSEELITDANVESLARKIVWYFSLNYDEKRILSVNSRKTARTYSKENSINDFQPKFLNLLKSL